MKNMDSTKIHPVVIFGMDIVGLLIDRTENNKYKAVRLMAILLTFTVYFPIVLIGIFIAFIGVLIELYQAI